MVRDTTDVKRRVMTQPLVVRNHKPLHGWFATALFLAGALASSGVAAANWRAILHAWRARSPEGR